MVGMRKTKKTLDWTLSEQAQILYRQARAEAQRKANELGFDHGLERNDLFRSFSVFMLPGRDARRGYETRCEVVMCENIDRCQPGHGPK